MLKTLLWLDDCRNPMENDWLVFSPIGRNVAVVWVKSFEEFVVYIKAKGLPDGICFDHDLADERENEKTGMDCAKFLVEYCIDSNLALPAFSSQSSNPIGRENILTLLSNFNSFN